nr:MAG TPA: hypothetical protein [Caudoviricetes sp.]
MKNILVIDSINGCVCDLLSNIDDGTNLVVLDVRSDISKNPYLEIESEIVNITSNRFLYVIPSNYYSGDGSVMFRIVDDDHTGDYFEIKQIQNLDGNLFLLQKSNFYYELALTSVQNETGVPIATDTSLGVVKGGDNIGIRSDGTMYIDPLIITDITYLSRNKYHFSTSTNTTQSIVINNCTEICQVLDKIPILLWGTANYSTLLTMIHLNMTESHVGSVVTVENIHGWEVSVAADYYGFTISGLNTWGNYVVVAPPGVLLQQDDAVQIPRS